MGNEDFHNKVKERGITRLCHFTKSRNLPFILGEFENVDNGIVANKKIKNKDFYEKNDLFRYDKKEDYICTSVQYPNSYLLGSDRNKNKGNLFNEWVIIEIDPQIIDNTALFSPVNAATGKGKYIKKGIEAFESLFANEIFNINKYRKLTRSKLQPKNSSTDIQAEVLIYEKIPRLFIKGIVFSSEELMKREVIRLRFSGIDLSGIEIKYSPDLFCLNLIYNLRDGKIPREYKMEVTHNG